MKQVTMVVVLMVNLLFTTGAYAAQSAESQAKMIVQTGLIYGEMASENISTYLKNLQDSSNISHGSDDLKMKIVDAVKGAEESLRLLKESLDKANQSLKSE